MKINLLTVGGAGYVGSIIAPALEREFECTHFDIKPVKGYEEHSVLADVSNEESIAKSVAGKDAVIYLAMGRGPALPGSTKANLEVIDPVFDVNVRGLFKFLRISLAAGVGRFIYVSTMSVYKEYPRGVFPSANEDTAPDCWSIYGMSKRTAEFICRAASQEYPSATIIVLRLYGPTREEDWPRRSSHIFCTGPEDTRRLFVKAVNFQRPGFHLLQAIGSNQDNMPNTRIGEVLGWQPERK